MSRTLKKLTITHNDLTQYGVQVESANCDGTGADIVNDYCTELSTLAQTCDVSDINNPLKIYKYKISASKIIGESEGYNVYENVVWYDYSSKSNLAGTYTQSNITTDAEVLVSKCTRSRVAIYSDNSFEQFDVGSVDKTHTVILDGYVNNDYGWWINYYPAGGGQEDVQEISWIYITLDSTVISY